MILVLRSILRALLQLPSWPLLRAIVISIALTLALLAGLAALTGLAVLAMVPAALDQALGDAGTLLVSLGAVGLTLLLSLFALVPVATLFVGLFLNHIAQATEQRYYPSLPPAQPLGFYQSLRAGVNLLGLVIAVNVLALVLYLALGPLAPLMFWGVNGYLLGREYFALVALRRLDLAQCKQLRRAHWGKVWLAGFCMAAPMSVPILNLLIPALGVAMFTHLFHALADQGAVAPPPPPARAPYPSP